MQSIRARWVNSVSKFNLLLFVLLQLFVSVCFAQEDMVSLNPATGNLTIDQLSRLAAGIPDLETRQRYLAKDQVQREIAAELKNSLNRVETTLKEFNKYSYNRQTGLAAMELERLEKELKSYQAAQKFAEKHGNIEIKYKSSLRVVTVKSGGGMRFDVHIDHGTGEKKTQMSISKTAYTSLSARGLLNGVSNPGSTQEIQTFKPVAEAIRIPAGSLPGSYARPQICSDCTTGGLQGEVIR